MHFDHAGLTHVFWNQWQYIVIFSIHSFILRENVHYWSAADKEICVKLCSVQPIKNREEEQQSNHLCSPHFSLSCIQVCMKKHKNVDFFYQYQPQESGSYLLLCRLIRIYILQHTCIYLNPQRTCWERQYRYMIKQIRTKITGWKHFENVA